MMIISSSTDMMSRSGNVVCHQAWMTVADLKGVELSYHVYDTFFF